MKQYVALLAAVVLLAGCEEGDGLTAITGVPQNPGGTNATISGRWVGDLTSSRDPFVTFPSVMQLAQTGTAVTGTLTISTGRVANVNGTVSGQRMTGTLSFTDVCGGTATTTVDVVLNGTRLSGAYNLNDCGGNQTGGFVLDRQG